MSQPVEGRLSDEDYRLIDANQLGIPLGTYRLKLRYIYLIRRIGLSLFIAGIVLLIAWITLSSIQWHQDQTDNSSKTLIFSFYQDIDELVALIRQQSGLA